MIDGKGKSGTAGERTEDAESAVPTKSPSPRSRDVPEEGYVYFILAEQLRRVKIGRGYDVAKRLKQLQTGSPERLKLLSAFLTDDPGALETEFHVRFAAQRVHGEWFELTDELQAEIDRAALFASIGSENVKVAIARRPISGVPVYRRSGESDKAFVDRAYAVAQALDAASSA